MKNFINVFVILVLVGLATGFVYMIENTHLERSCYGLGLGVVIIYMLLWGCKLNKDY
jgi:hypothetical protein